MKRALFAKLNLTVLPTKATISAYIFYASIFYFLYLFLYLNFYIYTYMHVCYVYVSNVYDQN